MERTGMQSMEDKNEKGKEVLKDMLELAASFRKLRFDADEVRERMITFMRAHYGSTLGTDESIALLDKPGGLEELHQKYCL